MIDPSAIGDSYKTSNTISNPIDSGIQTIEVVLVGDAPKSGPLWKANMLDYEPFHQSSRKSVYALMSLIFGAIPWFLIFVLFLFPFGPDDELRTVYDLWTFAIGVLMPLAGLWCGSRALRLHQSSKSTSLAKSGMILSIFWITFMLLGLVADGCSR